MTILYYLFLFLFLFLSVLLCMIILMQESKSTGLGASFGGDSGESLFGASTPEILKKITAWIAFCFMIGCIILSLWTGTLSRSKTSVNFEQIER